MEGRREGGRPRLQRPISSKLVKPWPPKAKTSDRPPSLPPASVYRSIYLSLRPPSFLPSVTENRFCDHLETDLSL